jgi:hypothetical protein
MHARLGLTREVESEILELPAGWLAEGRSNKRG